MPHSRISRVIKVTMPNKKSRMDARQLEIDQIDDRMPVPPLCAKVVYERQFRRAFGLRALTPLPLRDSAGLAPASPIVRLTSGSWRT
jgi:hypothetical protein